MGQIVAATFLFTDLVGSTALASGLSPAEGDDLRQRHFSLLRGAVESTGGREVKNLGDGLMVVFSSASRAVLSAVGMQQSIERHNRRSDKQLKIRIGLATGEATEEAGDFFGDPVVEAARLCAIADGGQILGTELVRLTVGRRLSNGFREVGEHDLKGLPEPVSVVEVQWEPLVDPVGEQFNGVPLPSRLADAAGGGLFGFAGRTREMAALDTSRKQSISETRLAVALIGGEPGVGKSSLAAQFARRVHEEGGLVILGECAEGISAPYVPWVRALSHLIRHTEADLMDALTPVHSWALRRLLPTETSRLPEGEAVDTDPETQQHLLMGSVVQLLEISCARAPLTVVLEDLHWADSSSLTLLRHVVSGSVRMPCLVVATYRQSDISRDHPLTALLADLHREPFVQRIDMIGLGDPDILELIGNAAGYQLDEGGVALAHALRRETDGNPFFVAELLRHLVESGAIAVGQTGRFELADDLDQISLPQSVRDVIGRRVARLGDESHRVLSTASVLGRDFDLDDLSRVTDIEVDRLLDLMDGASAASLVSEAEAPGCYRFTHALVQHALYGELSIARRQRVHLRVAEMLEATRATSGNDASRIAELARHWQAATKPGDAQKAVNYSCLAGDEAMKAFAPADAARWYAQALELVEREPNVDPRLRFKVTLALARALLVTEQIAGHATLKSAGEIAADIGDVELLVAWADTRVAGWRASEPADPDHLRLLKLTLSKVGDDELPRRARLLAAIADETEPNDWNTRHRYARAALTAAKEADDDTVRLNVFMSTSFSVPPEEAGEFRGRIEDALNIARRRNDPIELAAVLIYKVPNCLVFGDVRAAREAMASLEHMAESYGLALVDQAAAQVRVQLSMLEGDLVRLERASGVLLELGLQGFPAALAAYGGSLFELRRAQGRLGEFMELFANAATELRSYAGYRPALVHGLLESGKKQEALATFAIDASTGFDSFPRDSVWLCCMTLFADAAVTFGDRVAARALYDLMAPFSNLFCAAGPIYYGLADRAVGCLSGLLGDSDEAELRLRHALGVHTDIGARYWQAVTATDLAQLLLRRARPSDLAEAPGLIAGVRELATKWGFGQVEHRIAELSQT